MENDRDLINRIIDLIELHSKEQNGEKILKSFSISVSPSKERMKIIGYIAKWKYKRVAKP